MIKLSSAGGLAMTRQNRDFDTTITHARRKTNGVLCKLTMLVLGTKLL